ncbi:MAG: hypothetical protein RIS64_4322, partial [Bacteroidota bacterium]
MRQPLFIKAKNRCQNQSIQQLSKMRNLNRSENDVNRLKNKRKRINLTKLLKKTVLSRLRNFEALIENIMITESLRNYVSIERTPWYKLGVTEGTAAAEAKFQKKLAQQETIWMKLVKERELQLQAKELEKQKQEAEQKQKQEVLLQEQKQKQEALLQEQKQKQEALLQEQKQKQEA